MVSEDNLGHYMSKFSNLFLFRYVRERKGKTSQLSRSFHEKEQVSSHGLCSPWFNAKKLGISGIIIKTLLEEIFSLVVSSTGIFRIIFKILFAAFATLFRSLAFL